MTKAAQETNAHFYDIHRDMLSYPLCNVSNISLYKYELSSTTHRYLAKLRTKFLGFSRSRQVCSVRHHLKKVWLQTKYSTLLGKGLDLALR